MIAECASSAYVATVGVIMVAFFTALFIISTRRNLKP